MANPTRMTKIGTETVYDLAPVGADARIKQRLYRQSSRQKKAARDCSQLRRIQKQDGRMISSQTNHSNDARCRGA